MRAAVEIRLQRLPLRFNTDKSWKINIDIVLCIDFIGSFGTMKGKLPHIRGFFMQNTTTFSQQNNSANKRFRLVKKLIPVLGILLIVIVVSLIVINKPIESNDNPTVKSSTVNTLKKQVALNREFQFPIKDNTDQEVGIMKYTIESAELRDNIIVQGQSATSAPGRIFLVLNLKITNDLDKRLEITTRDYIRLQINDNHERLEFTIHNDPVEVGAISTRPTRIAIPIDDVDDQKLTLYIGEIKEEKERVEISFQ